MNTTQTALDVYLIIGQQRPSSPPPIDDSPARELVQPCRPGSVAALPVFRV
jgi:hypothetical protein